MFNSGGGLGASVIDIGTTTIRAGLAGEDRPRLSEHALIAERSPSGEYLYPVQSTSSFPLSDVRNIFDINSSSGQIQGCDYNSLDRVLTSIAFGSVPGLNLDKLEKNPILISEPTVHNTAYREKLVELAFESLGVSAAFVSKRSVLSAFAHGKTNAIVLSSGGKSTTAACVVGGYVNPSLVASSALAGDAIDSLILQSVSEQGKSHGLLPAGFSQSTPSFKTFCQHIGARQLKEDFCRVVESGNLKVQTATSLTTLPDGTQIDTGKFSQSGPDLLFGQGGVSDLVAEIFGKSGDDSLANSIIVCGGTATLPNFAERLQNDLNEKRLGGKLVKTIAAPVAAERRHSAWLGGSVVASLGSFAGLWISKAEYEEHGSSVVGKKCP